jgi:Tfp pilus assembly protein PilO
MQRRFWQHLDLHELPDWPLPAQLLALAAAMLTLALPGYALLLRAPFWGWIEARQLQQQLHQRLSALQTTATALERISPLLPRNGLGCHLDPLRARARAQGLTLLLGAEMEDRPQGALIEASGQIMLYGAYRDLVDFVSEQAGPDSALLLQQLSLARGSGLQLELQARLSCIRQPEAPPR